MIYIESKGGIGNQLYFANMAFRLQHELFCQVKLDNSWHEKKGNRAFALPNCIVAKSASKVGNFRIKKRLTSKLYEKDFIDCEINRVFDGIVANFRLKPVLLKGFFQADSLVSQDFIGLVQHCIDQMDLHRDIVSSLESRTLMHVRLGDYLTNQLFSPANPVYFKKALENCDVQKIIIMTDSPDSLIVFPELKDIPVLNTSGLSPFEMLALSRQVKSFIGCNSTLSRWISYLVCQKGGVSFLPVSNSGCKCCLPSRLVSKSNSSLNIH